MKRTEGGVTAARGFQAAGVEASVKYANRKDMALIYSTVPCVAAGTFTTNVVKRPLCSGTGKLWKSPLLSRQW